MIKMKRSAILAGILGFTLALSGCGGGGGSATEQPAAQPSDTPATTPKDEGNGGKTADKPNLRMIMQYGLFDPKTEYVAKYIQERTGFNVEYRIIQHGASHWFSPKVSCTKRRTSFAYSPLLLSD